MPRFPTYALIASLSVAPGALAPTGGGAQEGSVAYTHSVENQFEIPEAVRARLEAARGARGGRGGAFPSQRTSEVVVIFNATESLMKPVPRAPGAGREGRRGGGDMGGDVAARLEGFAARMRMGSTNRADRETLVEAHMDLAEGRIVEQREFLGRTFLIEDERPTYQWRLTGEQAEFLGYMVQKATAVQDSTTIEAWFTPQIPLMAGPGNYGGLPGMILVVSVNEGQEQYTATAVSLSAVEEGVIVRPEEGESVTREEYEAIVAEKLEELRMTRGRIRR